MPPKPSQAIPKIEDGKLRFYSSCCNVLLAESAQSLEKDKGLLIEEGEAVCKGIMCKQKIRFPEFACKVYDLTVVETPKPEDPK